MRKLLLTLYVICLTTLSHAQGNVQAINNIVTAAVALEPLHYLASDELKGRSPRRPEIDVAAKYISDQLKSFGTQELPGAKDYLQSFELNLFRGASSGSFETGGSAYQAGRDWLQTGGNDVSITAPVVFAGYGSADDLQKVDVKGKIVVTNFGINDTSKVRESLAYTRQKNDELLKRGAVAHIERFWQTDIPWTAVVANLSRDRNLQREEQIPVLLLNADDKFISSLAGAPTGTLSTSGNMASSIPAKNVVGWVEGTDPKLKEQFIVLSAHYDHVGVSPNPVMVDGKMDSIYNGARDNAIGVTAVLNAARYFAKHPAKRSVMFVLYTAEEMGLLGSRYFAQNPIIPLQKIVYNLNCDNGGYNDTSIVTVVGLGRTSADDDITKACAAYGVRATPDPVPELNLFDRSDNLNMAINGIPAPTFGMGITGFDSVIQKYYHQPADEVATFDLRYALVYVRSYILAAKNIADNKMQPTWTKNDKYEAAWKKLFGAVN